MKKMTSATTLIIVVMGLMVCHPAWADEASEKAAIKAAEEWLALVDKADYKKSWETAAALFKGAVTVEQWQQAAAAARNPLGAIKSRKVKLTKYATSLPGAPDGHYVVIQFDASYENKAAAVETITPMKDPDGVWRVSGYFIK